MNTLIKPEELIFECLLWQIKGHSLILTLNRPEKRNAINTTLAKELIYCLHFAKQNDDIRVVIIRANGKVFCAGGDLASMRGDQQQTKSTVPSVGNEKAEISQLAPVLRNLNKPCIVEAKGNVLAGALLIICNASHVYASNEVEFSAPEIKRGLWPYMVMAGLFRLISKRKGLDWIMRAYPINAQTAEDWGLINQSVAADKLSTTVDEVAKSFSQLPPKTMQIGLEAYNQQEDQSFDEALPYLAKMLQKTIEAGDAKEGITAFLEKRTPYWQTATEEKK